MISTSPGRSHSIPPRARLSVLALAFAACSSDPGQGQVPPDGALAPPDGSAGQDVGGPDVGTPDASLAPDAASQDAAAPDAASPDVGSPDSGSPDTGAADTGVGPSCSPNGGACTLHSGAQGHCCGGLCVDLWADGQNCGSCGNFCQGDLGLTCNAGGCVLASCSGVTDGETCVVGSGFAHGTCCNGTCVDLWTDSGNCRACGAACPQGACVWGNCVDADCVGAQDLATCKLATEVAGKCCTGACTKIEFDPKNCGACGKACPAGTWCEEGTCVASAACDMSTISGCPVSSTHGGLCCEGACVDIETDPTNCGYCGNACPKGAVCQSTRLGNYDCRDPGHGSSTICSTNADCPDGMACIACGLHDGCLGRTCLKVGCTPGVNDVPCAFGPTEAGTCCAGRCVLLDRESADCGVCGRDCLASQCLGGNCVNPNACGTITCSMGQVCTDGLCVDPTSPQYPPTDPVEFCSANGHAGFCCPKTGCTAIQSDPMNCGRCGWACAQGQTCVNGSCAPSSSPACPAGAENGFCDLKAGLAFGCCAEGCVDISSTATSCGQCNFACAPGLDCVAGTCTATHCTAATEGRSCTDAGRSGICCSSACVDLESDASNCGQCGFACSGTLTCKFGRCGLDSCASPNTGAPCHRTDSPLLGHCCAEGCVDTQTDAMNCSGCGLACPTGKACVGGGCK